MAGDGKLEYHRPLFEFIDLNLRRGKMQILKLCLEHENFFCPVTGQRILSDDEYNPSSATVGVWVDEVIDDPMDLSPEMKAFWSEYVAGMSEDDGYEIEVFLSSIDKPNWVAYEITTSGMGCGPMSSTSWKVIDMDYCHD